jgi:glycosyltransferase involved in cell wall biosynthesis
MKVATVIPSFQHARYLPAAIESVFGQTRLPDLVLVLDDGSTDDSVAVIERLAAEDRFRWRARENRGAHSTLNELVAWADSEGCDVVSILNSDDVFEPDRLKTLLEALDHRPDTEVLCSELSIVDEYDKRLTTDHPRARWLRAVWSMEQVRPRDITEWLGIGNFVVSTSNLVARTRFLRRFPFRPYRYAHDYYFAVQAGLRGKLEIVEQPLLRYRVHAYNTMNIAPLPLLKEMLRMHLDLARELGPELMQDANLRASYARYNRALWWNISSLHCGLLQTLLAAGLATWTDDDIQSLIAGLDEGIPELFTYPNKALVQEHDGLAPVNEGFGLVEKYQALRNAHAEVNEELKAAYELAQLQNDLLQSRKFALKCLMGQNDDVVSDVGGDARGKLQLLKQYLGQR